MFKYVLFGVIVVGWVVSSSVFLQEREPAKVAVAMKQFNDPEAGNQMKREGRAESTVYSLGWGLLLVVLGFMVGNDLCWIAGKLANKKSALLLLAFLPFASGCRRPFEPVKLEVVSSHEIAFLLPFRESGSSEEMKKKLREATSNNEAYLKDNLVYTQQIKVPQQWVQNGYETFGYNGAWKDAALLVKVDTQQITCEWTADPTTGTSAKNEAIWVMTSDQVEFSTGWTITARVGTHDDAVKFLHNYPNGSLKSVMDSEVRGKLQADFGLEVTDLPMETLRVNATPHILATVKRVTEFFATKGISITNLGITGGFIYKDKSILATMVRLFNAEQEKSIAKAEKASQDERNKTVVSKAEGEAAAILKKFKAEADGVRMVAEAKRFEIDQAKTDVGLYVQLKQMELQRELLQKWDGSYPRFLMGSGGSVPNLLMQMPAMDEGKGGKK
jgi:hypothetical protein